MKIPFITLSISILMSVLFIFYGGAPESFAWYANAEWNQLWRLLSAHFVHSDIEHCFWNVGAFIILGTIIEQHSKRSLLLAIGTGLLAVNGYLLTYYTLNAYVGLSGVLNAVLIVAVFQLCQNPVYRSAAIWTLILSMIKIMVELYSGTSVFTSISWVAVPQAHLAGWLGGGIFVLLQTANYFNTNKHTRYKQAINLERQFIN